MPQKYEYYCTVVTKNTIERLLDLLDKTNIKWIGFPFSAKIPSSFNPFIQYSAPIKEKIYLFISKEYKENKYILTWGSERELENEKLITWNKFIEKCEELTKENICGKR